MPGTALATGLQRLINNCLLCPQGAYSQNEQSPDEEEESEHGEKDVNSGSTEIVTLKQ